MENPARNLGCFAVIAASGAAYYTIVTQDAVLDEKKLVISDDKIEIFDANDRAVKDAAAFSPKETFRLDSLSEKVKFAFVDTEDKRFTTMTALIINASSKPLGKILNRARSKKALPRFLSN